MSARKTPGEKAAERAARLRASGVEPAERKPRAKAKPAAPAVEPMTTMSLPLSLKTRLQQFKDAKRADPTTTGRVQLWAVVAEALDALEREQAGGR